VVVGAGSAGRAPVITPVQRPVPLRQSVYEALVELVVGHQQLIDAVEAGDAQTASEVARRHTEKTRSAHHPPASPAGE